MLSPFQGQSPRCILHLFFLLPCCIPQPLSLTSADPQLASTDHEVILSRSFSTKLMKCPGVVHHPQQVLSTSVNSIKSSKSSVESEPGGRRKRIGKHSGAGAAGLTRGAIRGAVGKAARKRRAVGGGGWTKRREKVADTDVSPDRLIRLRPAMLIFTGLLSDSGRGCGTSNWSRRCLQNDRRHPSRISPTP